MSDCLEIDRAIDLLSRQAQGDRVQAAIQAEVTVPPDPYTLAFREALKAVRSEASSIARGAAVPPDPIAPAEQEAFAAEQEVAQAVVDTANGYLGPS